MFCFNVICRIIITTLFFFKHSPPRNIPLNIQHSLNNTTLHYFQFSTICWWSPSMKWKHQTTQKAEFEFTMVLMGRGNHLKHFFGVLISTISPICCCQWRVLSVVKWIPLPQSTRRLRRQIAALRLRRLSSSEKWRHTYCKTWMVPSCLSCQKGHLTNSRRLYRISITKSKPSKPSENNSGLTVVRYVPIFR